MNQSSFHLTSTHPDADRILRAALEAYARYARAHAVQKRHRTLHPGETRAKLEREAVTLDARAAAAESMLGQLPDGQVGTTP